MATGSMSTPVSLVIDVPAVGAGPLSGPLIFGGWCFSTAGPISTISYGIDGATWGYAVYGNARQDVAAAQPGDTVGVDVGWKLNFNTALLANGPHALTIEGKDTEGNSVTVNRVFQVENAPADPTEPTQPVRPPAAVSGITLSSLAINGAGDLIATYSDGSTKDLGHVIGQPGSPGPQGPTGAIGQSAPTTTFISAEEYDGAEPNGIGVIDGVNTIFQLSHQPIDIVALVFWGGSKKRIGIDYALNGQVLQTVAPIPASMAGTLTVWYWHS